MSVNIDDLARSRRLAAADAGREPVHTVRVRVSHRWHTPGKAVEMASAWCSGCPWWRSGTARAVDADAAAHVVDHAPSHVAQLGFDEGGYFWTEERDEVS